jgi:hypothetical protein
VGRTVSAGQSVTAGRHLLGSSPASGRLVLHGAHEGAQGRLFKAEPWDLVIVDEAHHFQAQERVATLTFSLLRALEDTRKISSLVLFTDAPHRGKDYGFLALMQLIRPNLLDPERDIRDQLPDLHKAMIRNNKTLATDLQGNKLFRPVSTKPIDYGYSPAEAEFRTMAISSSTVGPMH